MTNEQKTLGRKKLALRQAKKRRRQQPKLVWYAFRVKPQKEKDCINILRALGFVALMAFEKRLSKTKLPGKERRERIYCTCPGYIFLGFEKTANVPFFQIFTLVQDVYAVIAKDGRPAQLDQTKLLNFLNHEPSDLPRHYRFLQPDREFDVGEKVFILGGALEGRTLPVYDIRGSDAAFLMEFCGGYHELLVPLKLCDKAA